MNKKLNILEIILATFILCGCTVLPQKTENLEGIETAQVIFEEEGKISFTQTIMPTMEEALFTPKFEPPIEDTLVPQTVELPDEIEVIRLTYDDEEGRTGRPVWSPDGTRIIYTSTKYDEEIIISNVYVMNVDGSSKQRLTDFSGMSIWYSLAWSPDGEEIALTIQGQVRGVAISVPLKIETLEVHEAEKSPVGVEDLKTIVDYGDDYRVFNPEWSPDGKKLMFEYSVAWYPYRPGEQGYIPGKLGFMDLNTREVVFLPEEDIIDVYSPSWSQDGEHIAFIGTVDDWMSLNIWVMDADGGNMRQVTDFGRDDNPSWSPDGKWIVFDRYDGVGVNLHIVNVETGEIVQLTDFAPDSSGADWSPDGKWIAFTSSKDNVYGYPSIYLLDMSWLEMDANAGAFAMGE